MIAFRYTDLFPEVPMTDTSNVLEIYADSVADLKLHGDNFTATYFTWERNGPNGLLRRLPVVRIVRPVRSVFGMRTSIGEFMNAGDGVMIVPKRH